jgi:NifB/MoaA-like Fe-S oxidoreductase
VNDGPHLERSVADLSARYPGVRSIGVVPVGLTRYHRGKCRLYTEQEARAIVAQIAPLQTAYRAQYGASVVYLADEWYLVSGLDVPPEAEYDDYPQVENGIGLVRQFLEDSYRLQVSRPRSGAKSCTLVCGTSIAPIMKRVAGELAEKSGSRIEVVPVVNQLFGETVTVSGLLGGEDVLRALAERGALGEVVFLPRAMFAQPPACGQGRDGREVLVTLDDLAPRDFEDRLGRPVERVSYISEVCQRLGGRT